MRASGNQREEEAGAGAADVECEHCSHRGVAFGRREPALGQRGGDAEHESARQGLRASSRASMGGGDNSQGEGNAEWDNTDGKATATKPEEVGAMVVIT